MPYCWSTAADAMFVVCLRRLLNSFSAKKAVAAYAFLFIFRPPKIFFGCNTVGWSGLREMYITRDVHSPPLRI